MIKIRLEHAVKIQNGLPTERTDIPNRFDSALNERLKQIYVTSQNTVITTTLRCKKKQKREANI